MANVNFSGNIVNPELKFTNAGKPYFRFSVAENHRRKDQQGNYQDSGTTWWRTTFWGNALFSAEALAEAAPANTFVNVVGRTETRKYEKDGEQKEAFECNADTVGIMPKAPRDGGGAQRSQAPAQGGNWPQQAPAPTQGNWGPQNGAQGYGGNDQRPPF